MYDHLPGWISAPKLDAMSGLPIADRELPLVPGIAVDSPQRAVDKPQWSSLPARKRSLRAKCWSVRAKRRSLPAKTAGLRAKRLADSPQRAADSPQRGTLGVQRAWKAPHRLSAHPILPVKLCSFKPAWESRIRLLKERLSHLLSVI